jgi:hypothetical protein
VFSTTGSGETVNLLDAEFSLPPDQVREFQVQSRAFERASIEKIALRRRGGEAGSPAPLREQQASPAPAETRSRAALRTPRDQDSDGDGLSDTRKSISTSLTPRN